MNGQRSRLILSSKARQQFRELRRSIASVSGSEVTARNYMSALTDYIEQLPDFPLRGQAFSLGQVLWSGVIVLCPSGWVMR